MSGVCGRLSNVDQLFIGTRRCIFRLDRRLRTSKHLKPVVGPLLSRDFHQRDKEARGDMFAFRVLVVVSFQPDNSSFLQSDITDVRQKDLLSGSNV